MDFRKSQLAAFTIGSDFARQYYDILRQNPGCLHLFYSNNHIRSIQDEAKRKEIIYGRSEIHQKVIGKGYKDFTVQLTNKVCHTTVANCLLLEVFGKMRYNGSGYRKFMHTFVLAMEHSKKYYANTDSFNFLDEMFQPEEVWSTDKVDQQCMSVVARAVTPVLSSTPPPEVNPAKSVSPISPQFPGEPPVQKVPTPPTAVKNSVPLPQKPTDPAVERPVPTRPDDTSKPDAVRPETRKEPEKSSMKTSSQHSKKKKTSLAAESKEQIDSKKTEKATNSNPKETKEDGVPAPKTWANLMANCTQFNLEAPKRANPEGTKDQKPTVNGKPQHSGNPKKPMVNGKSHSTSSNPRKPMVNGKSETAGNPQRPMVNGRPNEPSRQPQKNGQRKPNTNGRRQ